MKGRTFYTPTEAADLMSAVLEVYPDGRGVPAEFWQTLGRRFRRPPDSLRMKWHDIRKHGAPAPTADAAPAPLRPAPRDTESATAADERIIELDADAPVQSLEALLAAAKVDRTVWYVDRWVCNKWDAAAKDASDELVTRPLWQIKAWLKRIPGADLLRELRAELLADIRATPRPVVALRHRGGSHLLTVNAKDLHIGKLAWAPETGENYDIPTAVAAFRSGLEDLLHKAAGFEVAQIVMPVGDDLLHVDNIQGTTTSGTPMDRDSRYPKMFRAAVQAMREGALRCAEMAPVRLVIVPGNHDRLGAFHVGEVLHAMFEGTRGIVVDNTPPLRKYVRWHKVLIGYTHGSEEKHADLPLIMATEQPEAWAATTTHEWHLGHLHKAKETRFTAGDSFNGVSVRILRSLSAADAWHAQKGYVGERREMQALLYHESDGFVGQFASRPLARGLRVAA
jgi:hypothetical protein